jgi:hypothetical protein
MDSFVQPIVDWLIRKERLKCTSKFSYVTESTEDVEFLTREDVDPIIKIEMVNCGELPVVLEYIQYHFGTHKLDCYFPQKVRLEKGDKEIKIISRETLVNDTRFQFQPTNIFVCDTQGRFYSIKNIQENLSRLWKESANRI